MGKELSSYQKGINRLLQHQDKFEALIIEYLLSVNSKYNSNMFPTTQIAKVLLAKLEMKKTQFPILHKIIRTIMNDWNDNGWCEYVTTTKSGRNRRTKFIYSFSSENFQFLKGRFISSSITKIEEELLGNPDDKMNDAMKSRDLILEGWMSKIEDMMNEIEFSEEDIEEADLPPENEEE